MRLVHVHFWGNASDGQRRENRRFARKDGFSRIMTVTVSQTIQRSLQEATGTLKAIRLVYNSVPAFALHRDPAANIKPIRLRYAVSAQAHKGLAEPLQGITPLVDRDDVEIENLRPKAGRIQHSRQERVRTWSAELRQLRTWPEAAHIVLTPSQFKSFGGGGLAEIVDANCALIAIRDTESLAARISEGCPAFSSPRNARLDAMLSRTHGNAARFSIGRINEDIAQCYRSLHQ